MTTVHPDNAFYGHGRVLARYAGVDDRVPIWGHVQHGWSTGTGFSGAWRLVASLPLFGWGERTRRQAAAAGLAPVTLIGAPFVYLADAVAPVDQRPRSTIVYPFHGTDRLRLAGSHDALAATIAAKESGPVTVCLYWADHTPAAIDAYTSRGFTVISHGRREDPGFLVRQLEELRRHDRIVTNRVSTALWYGAHLGLEAEVYGPFFGLEHERGRPDGHERFQRAEWPELHHGPLDGQSARALAQAELGVEHKRRPGELLDLLWPSSRARWGGRARVRAEHRARWAAANVARRLARVHGPDRPEPPRTCRLDQRQAGNAPR